MRVGVTTDEIDRVVHDATIAAGAYPARVHYHAPKSLCTSQRGDRGHAPRPPPPQDGDIVASTASSAIVDGYHTDLNETFCVAAERGRAARQGVARLAVGRCADAAARAPAPMPTPRPPTPHDPRPQAINECKRRAVPRPRRRDHEAHQRRCGFAVDKTYCGHGIGACFHCAPNIPHYAGNKAKFVIKPGARSSR